MSRALALVLLLVAAPVLAGAQADGEPALREIRELVLSARFGDAVTAARRLLDRTDLSASTRNAALEALAIAQIADQRQADARQTLALLYSRDPGHRLTDPDVSPPVLSAFARARESHPPPIAVRLEHETPTLTRRESPTLTVRATENGDAVHEMRLVYRMGDEGTSSAVMTRRADGTWFARIPVIGDASSAVDVAYHIVALAPSSTELARTGTEAEPLQLRIPPESRVEDRPPPVEQPDAPTPATPPPSGGSVAEEWWFWTIIAVVVIGGAVTTGVLLGPAQEGPEQGSLGIVRLMSIELP